MTHLSRFYISHSFKKEIGMSPMEYLIAIRIKESKDFTTNNELLDFSSGGYCWIYHSNVFFKTIP